jgi:hypothetical protein
MLSPASEAEVWKKRRAVEHPFGWRIDDILLLSVRSNSRTVDPWISIRMSARSTLAPC